MLAEMDAIEILEWAVYFGDEPWGFETDNWRFGTIAATVANLFGRSEKDPAFKWSDFMPQSSDEKKPTAEKQSVEQQVTLGKALAIAFGGKIRQRNKNGNAGARTTN